MSRAPYTFKLFRKVRTRRGCLEGLALMIRKRRMVLAAPGPLLTPPPSSSPPKTPVRSYSAQTPLRNGDPTPPQPVTGCLRVLQLHGRPGFSARMANQVHVNYRQETFSFLFLYVSQAVTSCPIVCRQKRISGGETGARPMSNRRHSSPRATGWTMTTRSRFFCTLLLDT